jgi:hypothetical protein
VRKVGLGTVIAATGLFETANAEPYFLSVGSDETAMPWIVFSVAWVLSASSSGVAIDSAHCGSALLKSGWAWSENPGLPLKCPPETRGTG